MKKKPFRYLTGSLSVFPGIPWIPVLLLLLLLLCPELYGGTLFSVPPAVRSVSAAVGDTRDPVVTVLRDPDSVRFVSFFFAALTHECGHLLMLRLFGIPVRGFRLTPAGAVLTADFAASGCSYRAEALVHIAGPAINLLSALLFSLTGCPAAAAAPLLLGIYNLLPVSCFDGGRLLHALLLSLFRDAGIAERAAETVSFLTAVVLYLFSGWVLWTGALHDPGGAVLRYGALFFAVSASILFLCGKKNG